MHRQNAPSSCPPMYNCYRLGSVNSTSKSSSPSPTAQPTTSARKGSKKVKTGCITCKIRKVKCDEAKPSCTRCCKTGRKCDGYLDPKVTSSKRRIKEKEDGPYIRVLKPLLEISSSEESQAFQFFQHNTAPKMSGDSDADFWGIYVLQMCRTEPAVWHAVLAISSLHQKLIQGRVASSTVESASESCGLRHYNNAIACLIEQMSVGHNKPLVNLLTCAIFVCIEFMQGRDKVSLIHLEQGRQLLRQLDKDTAACNKPIVTMYSQLSLILILFGGILEPLAEAQRTEKDIPDTFESMDELRNCLYSFKDRALHFAKKARPAKYSNGSVPIVTMRLREVEQNQLLSQVLKLKEALFLFRTSKLDSGSQRELLVIQMYLHAQHIWISTALSKSEVVYDNHLSSFAAIVPLGAVYLEQESSPHQTEYSSDFARESHVITTLYYVACKCRHPLIRCSALDLVRRLPSRSENLWQASVLGAMAGRTVEIENRCSQRQDLLPPNIATLSNPYTGNLDLYQLQPDNERLSQELYMEQNNLDPSVQIRFHMGITATNCMPEYDQPKNTVSLPQLQLNVPNMNTYGNPRKDHVTSVPSCMSAGSSGSVDDPFMAFVKPPCHHDNLLWQQQRACEKQQYQYQAQPMAAPQQSFFYSASSYQFQDPGLIRDNTSNSPSSFNNSMSMYDFSSSSSPVEQSNNLAHQQIQRLSTVNLNTEAPFGLPEESRIHDAIIGPEKEDGTWLTMFRKLHRENADWDVPTRIKVED